MASGCLVWRKDLIPVRTVGRDGDVLTLGGVDSSGRIRHAMGLNITNNPAIVTSYFNLIFETSSVTSDDLSYNYVSFFIYIVVPSLSIPVT